MPTNDELLAAAKKVLHELVRTGRYRPELDYNDLPTPYHEAEILARAVLLELDPTPVDAEWLKAVGAVRPMAAAGSDEYTLGNPASILGGSTSVYYPMLFVRGRTSHRSQGPLVLWAYGGRVKDNPSRGDVRTLARALGIKIEAEHDEQD